MAKKKKKVARDPKRFKVLVPQVPMFSKLTSASPANHKELCEYLDRATNDVIKRRCSAKEFDQSSGNCNGGEAGRTNLVDLVVVIDTSGSMDVEAEGLSNSANAAIQAAAQSCPSDLQVRWFGIEGTWNGTLFNQSYRDYLNGIGIVDGQLTGTPGNTEDGAAAVIDLARWYNWRPGAARVIFFLGDEAMEDGDPQNPNDVNATDEAINQAIANSVTVFTYLGEPDLGAHDPGTINDYTRLANDTGGMAFSHPVANLGGFQTVLEQIICNPGRTQPCQQVEQPKLAPCLHLKWGDGPDDRIETDDWEILCISACNPYSNVTLKNFTVHLVIVDSNGNPVPNLPDGTPSVLIRPDYQIRFGDLPPCNPDAKKPSTCVSREVVLISRGAIKGAYTLYAFYCFDACFTYTSALKAFRLDLVKS